MTAPAAARTTPQLAPALYAWFVVVVLAMANCVSFIDRLILSLLVTPLKAELQLSDTAVSLLQGAAFAIFYCVMGVIIARLADRASRKWIITTGVTLWCAMTTLSGSAQAFWQLFLFRIGVGVGEGTLSPSAYSLIAGYFPPHRLALAIGVFSAGVTAGMGLAYLVGGAAIQWVASQGTVVVPVLGALSGWRLVFALIGVIGLPVAVLMLFVREPARATGFVPAQFDEVLAHLRTHARSYLYVFAGYGSTSITIFSVINWTPTFYQRHYGAPISAAAATLGVVALVGGVAGAFAGGTLSDWLEQRGDRHAKLRVLFGCCAGLLRRTAAAGDRGTLHAHHPHLGGGADAHLLLRLCRDRTGRGVRPIDHAGSDACAIRRVLPALADANRSDVRPTAHSSLHRFRVSR